MLKGWKTVGENNKPGNCYKILSPQYGLDKNVRTICIYWFDSIQV